jgi:hypothetical protein
MPVQGTTHDRAKLDRVVARLRELASLEVSVGVQGPNGTASPPFQPRPNADGSRPRSPGSVALVASFHEFGRGVPKRSFIAATLADSTTRTLIEQRKRQVAMAAINGTGKISLDLVGKPAIENMRRRIMGRINPPLGAWAAKAARRKRRDKRLIPLYDTRQIWNNLRYHTARKAGAT